MNASNRLFHLAQDALTKQKVSERAYSIAQDFIKQAEWYASRGDDSTAFICDEEQNFSGSLTEIKELLSEVRKVLSNEGFKTTSYMHPSIMQPVLRIHWAQPKENSTFVIHAETKDGVEAIHHMLKFLPELIN